MIKGKLVNGIIKDREHVFRFKKIFGDDVYLVDVRAKFKYDLNSCGMCTRDLLLQNLPFYINLAAQCTSNEMREYLAEGFSDKLKRLCAIRHKNTAPCVTNLQYRVIQTRIQFPTETSIPHRILWKLDPNGRIFSVKATLLGLDNKVFNYFSTHAQLLQCLSETDSRIKADFSRILRYIRNYGRITSENYTPNEKTIALIKANISGLGQIPGNKIWSEMRIIVADSTRLQLMKLIFDYGGFKYIGLPASVTFDELESLDKYVRCERHIFLPVTYCCTFLNSTEDVHKMHQRLTLSAYERDLAYFLVKHKAVTRNIDDLSYYKGLCSVKTRGNKNVTKEYVLELLKYNNKPKLYAKLRSFEPL